MNDQSQCHPKKGREDEEGRGEKIGKVRRERGGMGGEGVKLNRNQPAPFWTQSDTLRLTAFYAFLLGVLSSYNYSLLMVKTPIARTSRTNMEVDQL